MEKSKALTMLLTPLPPGGRGGEMRGGCLPEDGLVAQEVASQLGHTFSGKRKKGSRGLRTLACWGYPRGSLRPGSGEVGVTGRRSHMASACATGAAAMRRSCGHIPGTNAQLPLLAEWLTQACDTRKCPLVWGPWASPHQQCKPSSPKGSFPWPPLLLGRGSPKT